MAIIPQHQDSVKDTWTRKFVRSPALIFTVHPISAELITGTDIEGQDYTNDVDPDSTVASLLDLRPPASVYTPGSFTIPATAVPIYIAADSKATYVPQGFFIGCKPGQTTNLEFYQYFVLMNEAVGPAIVYGISQATSTRIVKTPGSYHYGSISLEAS